MFFWDRHEMEDELEKLRAEGERLKHDIERHQKIAAELATENEKLRAENERMKRVIGREGVNVGFCTRYLAANPPSANSVREARRMLDEVEVALGRAYVAGKVGNGWHPITETPTRKMLVTLYSENRKTWNMEGEEIHPPHYLGDKFELGYWDGEDWREVGTNHEVFEFGAKPGHPDYPTHWMPVLMPTGGDNG